MPKTQLPPQFKYVDDVSGEDIDENDVEHFVFTYNGEERELYLGPDNAPDFKTFLESATKIEKPAPTRTRKARVKAKNNASNAEVRKWVKDKAPADIKALVTSEVGAVAQKVIIAYNAAH